MKKLNNNTILYTFNFEHHGKYSSFHRLTDYLNEYKKIDISCNFPTFIPDGAKSLLSKYWKYINEIRLYPFLLYGKDNIVHFYYPENSIFNIWKVKKSNKFILTIHQPISEISKRGKLLNGFLKTIKIADVVIVLSETLIEQTRLLSPNSKVVYIPHGVDTDFFKPNLDEPKEKIILSVGNWLRDFDIWVSVVEEIKRIFPDWKFIQIANSYNNSYSKKLLQGNLENVYFYENISDADLVKMYQKSKLLFLPLKDSIANNALLEAMACGIPIVTRNLPPIKNYLGNNTGILVENHKVQDYVSAIKRLIDDDYQLSYLSKKSREMALTKYDWKIIANKYRYLFNSLRS